MMNTTQHEGGTMSEEEKADQVHGPAVVNVRKVQKVNRSLMIVIPNPCARRMELEKGNYVTVKNVNFGGEMAIIIRRLNTGSQN